MVELPVTVYQQNNQKGIAVVFATSLLVRAVSITFQ